MRHIIVGTAGHIDHGKSALVKALTGTDPDRLKEEKLRGITIDLGFAHLPLPDVNLGFVDVPGHEKFVKNMLAGVGGIDFVLLVIAADESIMPQTREHFDICRLLGIQAGIVVLAKADLVDAEMIELVREEVEALIEGSFLEGCPVLPVSSRTLEGIEALKQSMRDLALRLPERRTDGMMRLPVDRAFSVHGFGTVVTGTLTSGSMRKDEEVELCPAGIRTKVRGIQVHGRPDTIAVAGQRVAINLQGVDLSSVSRGMVLIPPDTFQTTQILDVRLDLLPSARPLKNLVKVRFHQGTSEILARVALLGQDSMAPGRSGYAQLRLDRAAFCLHGDAFIFRQFSPAVTMGGGRILDPRPAKHKSSDRDTLISLGKLEQGSLASRIPVLLGARPGHAMTLSELNSLLGIPAGELQAMCSALSQNGQLILIPGPAPVCVLPPVIEALEKETIAAVADFHTRNPLQRGISREELREKLFGACRAEMYRYTIERLIQQRKIRVQEDFVSLFGREVQLSPEGDALRLRMEDLLRNAGYQPPGVGDLASLLEEDPSEVRKIYFWMLKEKILVKLSDDLTYHRSTLEEIKAGIRSSFPPGAKFGVAEFKELFGLTRKHAIPLLEYLDREKITRRQGNDRVLL